MLALSGAGLACDTRSDQEQIQDQLNRKQDEINRDLDRQQGEFKKKLRDQERKGRRDAEKLLQDDSGK